MLPHLALHKLCTDCDVPVEPGLAEQFTREIGPYPPGTLVRLQNGEVGVISARADVQGALAVHALRGPDGKAMPVPLVRMTSEGGCGIEEALHEDQANLRFSMKAVWGELAGI